MLDYQHAGLSICGIINMQDYQHAGLSTCRIINMPDYQYAGLSTCRIINMLDYQHAGLSTCWIINMPDHQGMQKTVRMVTLHRYSGLSRYWIRVVHLYTTLFLYVLQQLASACFPPCFLTFLAMIDPYSPFQTTFKLFLLISIFLYAMYMIT